ncbi:MAG: beta-lactamase family protein [Phycisphaera sp.]|nr:beta-lactamase family protein [Phycisphaera sp.]
MLPGRPRTIASVLGVLTIGLVIGGCRNAPSTTTPETPARDTGSGRTSLDATLEASAPERSRVMSEGFESMNLPAAVMGWVTRDGRTGFESFGKIDPDDPRPVGPDSLFDIASMTKAITTVAALQMVERGLVGLDEPLEPLMPELKDIEILEEDGTRRPAVRPLTLRDLLRHTSGFAYSFTSPQIVAELEFDPETGWPIDEIMEEGEYDWGFGIRPRRVFESGEGWIYGRGVGMAGKLVERLSGQDLDTYLRANVFDPLGMDRSGFNPESTLLADRVRMHVRDPSSGAPIPAAPFRADRLESFYGGGYLYSTPRDYTTFLGCLLGGGVRNGVRILEQSLVDEMMIDQLPEGIRVLGVPASAIDPNRRSFMNQDGDGFGFGGAIETDGSDGLRPDGVSYWSGAHNTYYTIDPERGIAIVFFSQMQPFDDVDSYPLYRLWEDEIYRALP